MAGRSLRQRRLTADYWPGFVDALSSLLLVLIFFLSIFMLAQFFLQDALSGRDKALDALRSQIASLTEELALKKKANEDAQAMIEELTASLAAATQAVGERETTIGILTDALEDQTELTEEAEAQVALLNQQLAALREQIASLEAKLEEAEERDREQQIQIANLGKRLNAALARRVDELARFRSEFFGLMREALKGRTDIRIVGDRFVFQSEVLFGAGSAELGTAGKAELLKVALALLEIDDRTPKGLDWVVRVDGHTDVTPIRTAQFPSNWELSAARAISVVKFLVSQGVPARRLAAAGFGEFQPIDPARNQTAYKRNRRIELKLTTQ